MAESHYESPACGVLYLMQNYSAQPPPMKALCQLDAMKFLSHPLL